ncbi:hypothetical protein H2509_02540 [Stappia sp. F7233]|uniref:Uncharacterized protein n=1 Tax=Stappia albiluteola TaxID=2758565 RepID=A0A839ABB8_9HYPH|nr:hypothetical protein [Stappia albiluteola]MBA5775999.1 hypothetical protein [Stappia albiluteola]
MIKRLFLSLAITATMICGATAEGGIDTSAGLFQIEKVPQSYNFLLLLNHKSLSSFNTADRVYIVDVYDIGYGNSVVVIAFIRGSACPVAYRVVDVSYVPSFISEEFGTCSDLPEFSVRDGELKITFPSDGNAATPHWVYSNGELLELTIGEKTDRFAGNSASSPTHNGRPTIAEPLTSAAPSEASEFHPTNFLGALFSAPRDFTEPSREPPQTSTKPEIPRFFEVIIKCYINEAIVLPTASCFEDTTLKLRINGKTKIINSYDLDRYVMHEDGTHLKLSDSFELRAQNSNEYAKLEVRILSSDGDELWQDEVAQYGVIAVRE